MTSIIPTTSSVVSIPSTYATPPGSPVLSGMSDTSMSIFETINSAGQSAILQNPVANVINGMDANITGIMSTVSNSTCLSGGDKTTINNGFSGLNAQLALLLSHTNTISGVVAAGTGSASPGLDQILSVGQSLNSLSNTINGASGCLAMLNGMTGLFSGDVLNGYMGEITGMLSQINSCLADATAIAARLLQMKNTIEAIISADQNFFTDAANKLKQAALAGMLEAVYKDPCGKFLLENAIGRTELLSTLGYTGRV